MDYQQIECFLTIAKTGSLNRAAEILFLSQPALTYRLKKLEDDIGYPLFSRSKGQHTTFLTNEGVAFLPIAERWKKIWDETRAFKSTGTNAQIKITATGSLNAYIFPSLFQELTKVVSHLEIRSHHSQEIYSKVSMQEFDIGFALNKMTYPNILSIPLFTEKMLFVNNTDENQGTQSGQGQLSIDREIFVDWGVEYCRWHNFWFGQDAEPFIQIDSSSLMNYFLASQNRWAFMPASILAANPTLQQFQKKCPIEQPPDRVCYMVINVNHPIGLHSWSQDFIRIMRSFLDSMPYLTKTDEIVSYLS